MPMVYAANIFVLMDYLFMLGRRGFAYYINVIQQND